VALEASITHSAEIARKETDDAYGESALDCRKLALGLLAISTRYLSDETRRSLSSSQQASLCEGSTTSVISCGF
jgi:hypothetical protein